MYCKKLKFRVVPLSLALSLLTACATQPLLDTASAPGTGKTPKGSPALTELAALADAPDELPHAAEDADEQLTLSLWDRFRQHARLDLTQDNAAIQAERRFYQNNPAYIERVLSRAEPYLYHIQSEIERRGLPSELLLLPIVESAYDPFAYSHGRAAGLWQFVPGTARTFGLKQSWWYEGRRDVVASTDAALRYLAYLHRYFDGDWLLALAAYNAGEGTVSRAVADNRKRGLPTDFWSLKLRSETSAYVPKLIAISQIFMEPEKYNISLREVPFEPYFAEVDIQSQLDLAQAARMAGISIEELYRLNPAYNRWATDPTGPHRLLVPLAQAEQFQLELDNMTPEQRVQWERYTIQKGDTVSTISRKFHITPDLLKSVNGMKSDNLRAGATLLIPHSKQPLQHYALSAEQRLEARQNRTVSGKQKVVHRVAAGDSFWSLSRKYNVDMRQLASWNGMAPADPLVTGKELVIWTSSGATVAKKADPLQNSRMRKIQYRARSGDSYAAIASRFNVTLNEIKRWNNINLKKYLQPGDMLTLYVDVANAP